LLHIAPGDPGYSKAVFGFHLYTWSFLSFVGVMIGVGVLLCLTDKYQNGRPILAGRITGLVMLAFLVIVLGNVVSTLLECGLTQCPADPVRYMWLESLSHSLKAN